MTKQEIINSLSKDDCIYILNTYDTYSAVFLHLFKNHNVKPFIKKKLKEKFDFFELSYEKIDKRKNYSPIWKVSIDDFKKIVEASMSIQEILSFFGLKNQGSNFRTLKRRFEIENISYEDFVLKSRKNNSNHSKKRTHSDDLFIINSKSQRGSVRGRILKDQLKPYLCEICGQKPFWNGMPMTLILDHINGVNNDHRLENLRFVCANCNIQLDTTNGKNKNLTKIIPSTSEIDFKLIEIEKSNLIKLSLKPIKKDLYKMTIRRFSSKEERFCLECDFKIKLDNKSGLCFSCLLKNKEPKYSDIMEVYDMVVAVGYVKTGKHYGVSDKSVSKWLKKHNLNPLEKKNTENFINMAFKLKEFIALNNTFPSYKETELWNWMQAVRGRYKTGTVKEDEIMILNNISERILKPESNEDLLEKGFKRLEDFLKKEKRMPRRSTKNKDEDLIAIFIKNEYKRSNPERVERIKNLLSSYNL